MRSFTEAFCTDLVALEMPDVPSAVRAEAVEWTIERIRRAGSQNRLGLGVAAALLATVLRLKARGRAYASLPAERRTQIARSLSTTGLPVAAEYVKALRALAITRAYEP